MWGFGRFLGIIIVIQVAYGLLLALFYVRGESAWTSIILLTREVRSGWFLRLIHRNIASFVFIVLFIHYFRAIIQSSFYLKTPWVRGWIIKVFTMAAAFLGYVLPWGQMSFWGATVIINLLRVLPKGKILVVWLWSGFYVSSYTCSFFYAIHFLVPLIVLLLAGVHILMLHFSGRTVSGGIAQFRGLKIKFRQLFIFKDIINIILIWLMFLLILLYPDWSADPVNFIQSDLSNSPLHIQPEWYFLHLYAILRSIPNKVGGLIGFALALILLVPLILVKSKISLAQMYLYTASAWIFLTINSILLWLGIQPVEDPYIFIGQTAARLYFFFFISVILMDIRILIFI